MKMKKYVQYSLTFIQRPWYSLLTLELQMYLPAKKWVSLFKWFKSFNPNTHTHTHTHINFCHGKILSEHVFDSVIVSIFHFMMNMARPSVLNQNAILNLTGVVVCYNFWRTCFQSKRGVKNVSPNEILWDVIWRIETCIYFDKLFYIS